MYSLFKPLYYYEKMFGFVPITIYFDKRLIKVTKFDVFLNVGQLIGYAILCQILILDFQVERGAKKSIYEMGQ